MTLIKHHVAQEEVGRVDLVVQKLTERSRTQVRGLFDHGCVSLNGEICTDAGARVARADEIFVDYDKNRNYKELPKRHRSPIYDLVFEDEWLLIVDKKAGYLTVPNRGEPNTLVGALCQYMSLGKQKRHMVSIVHRLDRDTSGLLVFAKSDKIAQQIKSQFEKRKPLREYLAIVAGHLKDSKGTFRSFLATDIELNQYSTDNDEDGGKLAITHYVTKQVLKDSTYVSVTLETGRRNQIRVHFAEIGHPVLGDVRYESKRANHPKWKNHRLALHAALLGFKHPVSGKDLVFRSKTPEEFEVFMMTEK